MPQVAPSSLGRWTGGCRFSPGLSLSPEWVTDSPGVQRSVCWLGGFLMRGAPPRGGSGGWQAAGSPGVGMRFQSRCGAQAWTGRGGPRVGTWGSRDARLCLVLPLGSTPPPASISPPEDRRPPRGLCTLTLTPLRSEPIPSLWSRPSCPAWPGCPGSTVGSWSWGRCAQAPAGPRPAAQPSCSPPPALSPQSMPSSPGPACPPPVQVESGACVSAGAAPTCTSRCPAPPPGASQDVRRGCLLSPAVSGVAQSAGGSRRAALILEDS